jgi:hypothetical protein
VEEPELILSDFVFVKWMMGRQMTKQFLEKSRKVAVGVK